MMDFLKKHQRKIFIVITVMTIASFLFFGTFSTFIDAPLAQPDRVVVKGVSGKPLMKRELDTLSQLLSTSSFIVGGGGLPNLLNDGVLEKQFLSNGMSRILSERYFPLLKEELTERLHKMKQFRPYAHPQIPMISAYSVWQRFSPQLIEYLTALKKQEEVTPEVLTMMIQLYLDQAHLPPELLKRILLFQMQQQGIALDPGLARADLSLFGFSSLEEWFGPRFVQLHAQFIANTALVAEEKGYTSSKEEVRMNLFQNLYAAANRLSQNETPLTPQEAQNYFHHKMQEWGIQEKELLSAWRTVLLFRHLFDDVGGSVLLDSLAYQQFHAYSEESATINLYEIPTELRLSDFDTLLKLQVYLEAISPQTTQTHLNFPTEIFSIEQLEKSVPSLVERSYEIEFAEVKKSALANEIPLRMTWEWETQEENFALLCKQFSSLSEKAATKEQRFAALDALDGKTRSCVDQFARAQMVSREKILNALECAEWKTQSVQLRKKGGNLPFSENLDRAKLYALLEEAALNTPIDCATKEQEVFYRIKVLKREDKKRILSFAQAKSDATLDTLLNQRLEEAYADMRKKNPAPFQKENGFKPLKEVRDLVGRHVYRTLLKTIEEAYKTTFGPLPGTAGELPLNFYCNYRLFFHMHRAKESIREKQSDALWVKSPESSSILDQWRLEKTERKVKRSDALNIPKEEMFRLKPSEWSSVSFGSGGTLAFYQMIQMQGAEKSDLEQIGQGQQLLAGDAQRQLLIELLDRMERGGAIEL